MQLFFEITLSKKDKALLEKIKNFFNANLISKHGPQSIQFRVQSIKELQKFLDHFAKYPLITNKCADLEFFKKIFVMMLSKEHLTLESLIKIIAIKASMNRGLSDVLKKAFPDVVPLVRPIVEKKVHDLN